MARRKARRLAVCIIMARKPPVVKFAGAFCLVMAVVNLATAWLLWRSSQDPTDWVRRLIPEIEPGSPEFQALHDALGHSLFGAAISSAIFTPLSVALAFLKPKPATYYLHMTNFIATIGTCVCAPVAIPALFAWFKPDVQDYFGVPRSNKPKGR